MGIECLAHFVHGGATAAASYICFGHFRVTYFPIAVYSFCLLMTTIEIRKAPYPDSPAQLLCSIQKTAI